MAPIQLLIRSCTPSFDKGLVAVEESSTATTKTLASVLYPGCASEDTQPKLFFEGHLLYDHHTPVECGVKAGSTLVAVARRQRSSSASQPATRGSPPDQATVDALTIAEAKARGLPEEAPPSTVQQGPRLRTVEAQIMSMLQGTDFGGGFSGEFANEEDEEEEDGAEPADVEVPEPDPQGLANLQEMGFSAGAARRALLLNHNDPEAAVDWVLRHGSDANLEAPLTSEELQAAWRPRRRRHHRAGVADPELVQHLVDMGFDRDRSSSALIRVRNDAEHACQMLLAEDQLREAVGAATGTTATAPGGAAAAAGTPGGARAPAAAGDSSTAVDGAGQPTERQGGDGDNGLAGMDASGSSSSGYTTDDEAGGDEHMMGASSEEGGHPLIDLHDSQTDDSDLDEYDMDDSDSNSDMDEGGSDMQMPPPAEDDYEVGLQDLPDATGGVPSDSISMGVTFGPDGEPFHAMVGLQDLISNHNDEQIIQEIQSSPMMIDAVQSLLAGGGAPLAHLSEHPEMAPLVRRLRRIVGIETDNDEPTSAVVVSPAAVRSPAAPGNLQRLSQALVALVSQANTPGGAVPLTPGPAAAAASPAATGVGSPPALQRRPSTTSRARSLRTELADDAATVAAASNNVPDTSQQASTVAEAAGYMGGCHPDARDPAKQGSSPQ